MNPAPVTRLDVRLEHAPGDSELVGQLALDRQRVFLEFAATFLAAGRSLSPLKLALQPGLHPAPPGLRHGLHGCFGVRRFDRVDGGRLHMHSLAGLLHADYRLPGLDYDQLIRVTMQLTRDHGDVRECFRRALFNWLAHNRDDHGNNFAFLMRRDGTWSLSPAYDLTFADGPGGEHMTTFAGEGRRPTWKHLQQLARLASIEPADALRLLAEVQEGVASWTAEATALKLPTPQTREIARRLSEVADAASLPSRTTSRSPRRPPT